MAVGSKTAGSGRKKGTPNKATAALKEAILQAFAKVGGQKYLVQVAETDPKTFCTLLGRVLPLQVNGAGADGEHRVVTTVEHRIVQWPRPTS